jgi:hypothetical protein
VDCKFSSPWGGWCSNEVYKLYVVRLWKNVEGLWVFSTHTKFEVENGSKIRFGMTCGVGIRLFGAF